MCIRTSYITPTKKKNETLNMNQDVRELDLLNMANAIKIIYGM